MSFLDRARQAAEHAAHEARDVAEHAAHEARDVAGHAAHHARATAGQVAAPPALGDEPGPLAADAYPAGEAVAPRDMGDQARELAAQARQVAGQARRTLATAVDRIDPGLLADVVIKATALQERTNLALHAKGSAYRIGEVNIAAAIPPQISFSIVRVTDLPDDAPEVGYDVRELGGTVPEAILSLDPDGTAESVSLPPPPGGRGPGPSEAPAS